MGFQLAEMEFIRLTLYRKMLLSRVKMRLFQNLPQKIKKHLFFGSKYYCPVCESHVRNYMCFGHIAKSWCPICTSMERHRFAWLFFQKYTNLFEDTHKKMLHIAPEVAFERRFKQCHLLEYVTADMQGSNVMVTLDITKIPFLENTFDIVLCSHVMEHIADDRKAMHELARVLNAGGWAVFMVPIRMNSLTDEDPSLTQPEEREKRFGQYDHVRFYGRDFEDRLKEAGFKVTVVRANEIDGSNRLEYLGISEYDVLFYCHKNVEVEDLNKHNAHLTNS